MRSRQQYYVKQQSNYKNERYRNELLQFAEKKRFMQSMGRFFEHIEEKARGENSKNSVSGTRVRHMVLSFNASEGTRHLECIFDFKRSL